MSVFIAISLDGFIAKTNGDIAWLDDGESLPEGEDCGYKALYDSVDGLIMGRNTMEKVLGFDIPWPYDGKPVFVLSKSLKVVPEKLVGKIQLYSNINDLMSAIDKAGFKKLYVDGGKTIQTFINKSLITDLTITTIPILLGDGLPLFGKIPHDIKLNHLETVTYPNGFVKSSYEICL